MTIARQVDGTVEAVAADLGHDADRLVGRDHLNLHADGLGLADTALQFLELGLAGGNSQAADVIEQPQLAI